MSWQTIETAPKDGSDIIVGFDAASVWVVHVAWWNGADQPGFAENGGTEADIGWWSYTRGSVTQEQLDGHRAPTHWIPLPDTPAR
jgi:hypothetical protein